jgi:MFS family permease
VPFVVSTRTDAVALRRNRDLRNLLISQSLSALGDAFALVAIPLLVLHATHSVAQMGLVTGLAGVASIITGVFSGVIIDRFDRRILLIICDLARCVLFAAITVVWLFTPQLWLIYVVMGLAAAFSMIFDVGYVTVVPAIVAEDQITDANGLLFAAQAIASVAGPALAGLVSGLWGPSAAVGVDAASFLVSAAGLMLIRLRPTAPVPGEAAVGAQRSGGGRRLLQDLLEGVRFLWHEPVLRALTAALTIVLFFTTGLNDLIVYDVEHGLHHSDGAVGAVMAAGTVGTFLGSALVARVRRRAGFGGTWIGGTALGGLAICGLGVAGNLPVLAVLAAAAQMCIAVGGIASMSLRQEITPGHLLGRVTAAFWTVHNALGPVGAALLTAAAAGHGAGPVLAGSGLAVTLTALAAIVSPIGRADRAVAARDLP